MCYLLPSLYGGKKKKSYIALLFFMSEHMQIEPRLCPCFLVKAVLSLVTCCFTRKGCSFLCVWADGTFVMLLGAFVCNIQAGISLWTSISRIAFCVCVHVCVYVITGKSSDWIPAKQLAFTGACAFLLCLGTVCEVLSFEPGEDRRATLQHASETELYLSLAVVRLEARVAAICCTM